MSEFEMTIRKCLRCKTDLIDIVGGDIFDCTGVCIYCLMEEATNNV